MRRDCPACRGRGIYGWWNSDLEERICNQCAGTGNLAYEIEILKVPESMLLDTLLDFDVDNAK